MPELIVIGKGGILKISKRKNEKLHKAKKDKKDDFYTQRTYIEKELKHYKNLFKNKVVLCNCDDPTVSQFFFYFHEQFQSLKLKKLITTCYKNQDIKMFSDSKSEKAVCLEYDGKNIVVKNLKGDGDFRSPECIEILKQADIVVTNPPFSLFREYVAQLIEYKKKFLIMGNINAITYKEVFPLFNNNEMWLGYSLDGRNIWFGIPDDYEEYDKIENGKKYSFVKGVVWFTNLPRKKQKEQLDLVRNYKGNEKNYPKYDNYGAIEVSRVENIPKDYDGVMGVPITFLNKYNPEQFEIVGNLGSYGVDGYSLCAAIYINGQKIFKRILIRRKKGK